MNTAVLRSMALAAVVLLASACGGGSSHHDEDAGAGDGGIDSGSGDDTDTASDTGKDSDSGTDTGTDSDTGSDTETDTGTGSDSDTDVDSDTDSDTDTDTDTDSDSDGSLALTEVQPQAAPRSQDTVVTLIGVNFEAGMTVALFEDGNSTEVILGEATVELDGTSATVLLPADPERPQGLYDVTVTNPGVGGEDATLFDALFVSALDPPVVTNVEPPLAWNGDDSDKELSDRTVQIEGEGFVNTPWVAWVSVLDPNVSYDALEVHFIDSGMLEAVVPSESASMPAGDYYVWVKNPDKLSAQWILEGSTDPGIFVITETPPPRIDAVDPVQWPFMDDLDTFTVTGDYFQDGATIAFVTPTGDVELDSIAFVSETELTASIGGSSFDIAFYPVRVTNPDTQWDIFYIFEMKNGTSAHFDQQTFDLDGENTLSVARERLDVEFGFDDFGGTHLYAAGGLDSDGNVLGDVETATVNLYGDLGTWRTLDQWISKSAPREPNVMVTPRAGHRLVRAGRWLYAIGGSDTNTSEALDTDIEALNAVERARILGLDTRPDLGAPTNVGDGELPVGTWYYRVSAVGDDGESLASKETQILNSGGSLRICWDSDDGASTYNLYRSPASDGRAGSVRLIESDIGETCFVDDGEISPAPGFVSATSVPDTDTAVNGTLGEGVWVYRVTSVTDLDTETETDTGAESVAGYRTAVAVGASESGVKLSWQEVPGATYKVYRTLSAASEITGEEETYLIADGVTDTAWIDDGTFDPDDQTPAPDGVAPLRPGSLGLWQELPGTLRAAREGPGAVVVKVPSGSEIVEDKVFIYVAGGRANAGGTGYLKTVEKAEVLENGDLGQWNYDAQQLNTARAFFPLLTSQDRDVTPTSYTSSLENGYVPYSIADEPIYIFALQGDESFVGSANKGLTTMEAAEVGSPSGALVSWVEQAAEVVSGRATYAHDGVVVDDYLYVFPGVFQESIAGEPTPLNSNTSRFPIVIPPDPADELLGDFTAYMAANAEFVTKRSYYACVKVNAHVYVVGGNDGIGPIDTIESIPQ